LTSQKNFVISFGLEKIPQKYPQNYVIFKRLGMMLAMKPNSIDKKVVKNVHHINIEVLEKRVVK
jgi:hypothetical protein